MKILTVFGICALMLVGCTSAEYQKMQAERDHCSRIMQIYAKSTVNSKLKPT